MTATQIIEQLGGTSFVAKSLDLTPSTVSSWKTSGNIPKWRIDSLKRLADEKGVSLTVAA